MVVPEYEICMEEPLVTASRRRRKETSCGARPGFVGEELRILEMWMGRPVRVAMVRRRVKDRWPVNRRYSGEEPDIVALCIRLPDLFVIVGIGV